MREIKFRFWHKEAKIMTLNLPLIKCNNILEDEIPMQFTGLKDKNGKEIYEGDIIKCNYCDKDFGKVIWLKDTARFIIRWKQMNCGNARHTSMDGWCEVIGNIYENPDLLEPKGDSQ